MDVNLKSVYLVCRHAMPHPKLRRGAVVNMASVQSFATQRGVAAYTTGKHALLGLSRSMALDFAADGVRVNAVAPGSVDTPMLGWAIRRDGDPAALAAPPPPRSRSPASPRRARWRNASPSSLLIALLSQRARPWSSMAACFCRSAPRSKPTKDVP
jgi:NAD(P)-dependent dehydrogenase (short-subunit alcohol dehydrogenase family)